MKIKTNKLLFKLLCIFPLTTILQGISIFEPINRVIMILVFLLLTMNIIEKNITFKKLLLLLGLVFSYIMSFIYTTNYNDGLNNIFYLGIWCIFFIYLNEKLDIFKSEFQNNHGFVNKIFIITTLTLLISMFMPSSYTYTWGSGRYFISFSNGEHRLASACIYLISQEALMYILLKNKKYLLYSLVPAVAIIMTGARTYLVLLLIFYSCVYYMFVKRKSTFYLTIIPLVIIVIYAIMQTSMGEKFIYTMNDGYYGWLGTFTSGRTVFWEADLKEFGKLPLINKFFGNGYNFVYDINDRYFSARIWAHNDFINLLLTNGYLGLILYITTFVSFTKKNIKKYKIEKKFILAFYLIYLFNAVFNMEYTYVCSTLSLPIVIILFSYYQKEINNKKKLLKRTNN